MVRLPDRLTCAVALAAAFHTASLAVAAAPPSGQDSGTIQATLDFTDRASLVAALERLLATGEPPDTSHDDGQLLRWNVEAAIARGDAEIERLAVRASAPLIPAISNLISSTQNLPSFGVSSLTRLPVPRPVPYTAAIYASVDGEPFVKVVEVKAGAGADQRIDRIFSARATLPGYHHVRTRARVMFTPSSGAGWTEDRDLAEVAYGLYDENAPAAGPRMFLDAARLAPVRDLDPSLSEAPSDLTVDAWLQQLVARPETNGDRRVDWMLQYCAERTTNTSLSLRSGDLCMVAYMQAQSDIERVWIRTGTLSLDADGPHWRLLGPAVVGVNTSRKGAPASSLSGLAGLLRTAHDDWPEGDVSIDPSDVVVIVDADRIATINVTVRNLGSADLYGLQLYVTLGDDPSQRALNREFVFDIPADGEKRVSLRARLSRGYGFVLAHAMQAGQHSPHDSASFDPTPEDACALRIVNARLAPPELTRGIAVASGCRVY
jgi:hypothetical protein